MNNTRIICGNKIQLPGCIDGIEVEVDYKNALHVMFDASVPPIPVKEQDDAFEYCGNNMQELHRLWIAQAYDLPTLVICGDPVTNKQETQKGKISPHRINIPDYLTGFRLESDERSANAIINNDSYIPIYVSENAYYLASNKWEDLTKLMLARQYNILLPITIVSCDD